MTAATLWAVGASGCRPRSAKDDAPEDAAAAPATREASLAASRGGDDATPVHAPPAEDQSPVRVRHGASLAGFSDQVAALGPSVVQLFTDRPVIGGPGELRGRADAAGALGSGVVFDEDGHIVSSDRALGNARQLKARFVDGSTRSLRVIGRDPLLDLAVLVIDDSAPLPPPARLGTARALAVGDWVVAVGNPFGSELTASAGIVMSRQGARHGERLGQGRDLGTLIETDALIDGANAGGPVLDASGAVVGIAVARETRGDAIGRAIPIDLVRDLLPQLSSAQPLASNWLGVRVLPTESGTGALISEVVADGPGARAKLAVGDVILRVDGRTIDDVSLAWWVRTAPRDRAVEVVIRRAGLERSLLLTVEALPQ